MSELVLKSKILNDPLFVSVSRLHVGVLAELRGPGGVLERGGEIQLTVDGDGFSVLQDDVPRRHLHGDRADSFPGEGAGHTSIQGDDGLLESRTDEGGREREAEEEKRQSRVGFAGERSSSRCCYLHVRVIGAARTLRQTDTETDT